MDWKYLSTVYDDNLTGAEHTNRALSHLDSDPASDEDETPGSQAESEFGFEGDTLQTAQDKIMSELARLKDSDGEDVSYPFIGKPDRNLYKDYYAIIQHPVSLRSIQKKRHFKERVAEAKRLVPDQSQVDGNSELPRIKLKMGKVMPEPTAQRLSLKLSAQGSDIASKDIHQTSSVAVNDESLKRQRDHVRTESTGEEVNMSRTRSFRRTVESPESSGANTPAGSEQHQGLAGGRDMFNSIKNETGTSQVFPGSFADASATEIPQYSSGSGRVPLQQPLGTSPTDSFLRRPGQGLGPAASLSGQYFPAAGEDSRTRGSAATSLLW
ncbi:hypothetical protein PENANT_c050G02992 [Penicillium antarcticum]|uniref:Bromo domain-containing protein n=1 Tax=Penicillium antarcticum TaxID=416450 RepID=A0A1V6PSM0_9EURO|nr:hypothetical protein PENANT_c050G02992 [Penicillium antarcticum]